MGNKSEKIKVWSSLSPRSKQFILWKTIRFSWKLASGCLGNHGYGGDFWQNKCHFSDSDSVRTEQVKIKVNSVLGCQTSHLLNKILHNLIVLCGSAEQTKTI